MTKYTEDTLVQQTTADFLNKELGWESVYAFQETLGENGLLGRQSYKDVILTRYLDQALKRINPGHPPKAYQDTIAALLDSPSSKDTFAINRDKHKLIRDGHQVSYTDSKGKPQKPTLRYIDFNDSENNHFLCVRELWITDTWGRNKRADIIGFINGIPLLFCELKNLNKDLKVAYDDNYTDYLSTIKHLFYYNAIVLLGNGNHAKIGSLGSPYAHFHDWKRLEEKEPGRVDMETLLRGICDKTNLLDIIENFIIFDDSGTKTVKIIAQNHQYLGVNRAIEAVKDRKKRKGKLGVFWHTQGSGKSYSMVFFTRKIQRKLGGNFSFIICTDRKDLDKQIYETFAGCGLANADKDPCRAASHEQLSAFLQTRKAYIFTLIQKFNQPLATPNLRDDIIVISDEAHRTQYGNFARNMRDALPNAGYIGFTGTPLISEEQQLTREIFGDYVSTYDFQRAVEDQSTVPLYYDARGEKLEVTTNDVNDRIAGKLDELEASGEDDDTIERLKKALGKDYGILTSEKRLETIAQDFVDHYSTSWGMGKAMFICLDKLTCVKMYNKITHHWQQKIADLKLQRRTLTDQQAAIEYDRKIAWMEETIAAVMVSNEQNEVKKFQDWGLDINPHRALINNGFELEDGKRINLEKAFKKEDHPFRVAIVCAMWLTGFDVPSLSILYLDKPLKAHTLMQAIARANRVNEGKHNGLIVDYGGILDHLRQALATFAGTQDDGRGNEDGGEQPVIDPTQPQQALLQDLKKAIDTLAQFFKGYHIELQQIVDSEGFEKNHLLSQAQEAANTNDDTRKHFIALCQETFKIYNACLTRPEVSPYTPSHNAIKFIYKCVTASDETPKDINSLLAQFQDVIDESISVISHNDESNQIYDISQIDFDKLRQEFEKTQKPRTSLYDLKTAIERTLNRMVQQNSSRINYQERFEAIIDRYNRTKDQLMIQQTFDELLNFIQDLSEEDSRAQRENLEQETLAIFDKLREGKDNLSKQDIKRIKDIAIGLLQTLKQKQLQIDHWQDKESTRSEVQTVIHDYLYNDDTGLPIDSYTEEEVKKKSNVVYMHIFEKYPRLPSPYYEAA